MHEKMLMLLVFLYIMASFRQEKVILRLTSRLIIIKIGPSFLVLWQWPVVHWVAPCAYHLHAAACVIGHVPFTALHFPMRLIRESRGPKNAVRATNGGLLLPIA
jgi:hypothetical protein